MSDTIHTPETHRRERILDDWLDRIEAGRATADECLAQHPELRDEMEPMLRAAQRLFALEVAPLSSETVRAIRDQVFARVPAEGKQGASARRLGLALPWTRLAGIAVALVLVLAAALGGAWTISADSLPGSPLYPIKRGAEAAQVAFTHSPADRAYLHVSFALRRVDEGLRLEPSAARWNEQTMAALEELSLAEDSIGQAEKAEVAIDWRQIARLGEAGERELAGIDLAGPAGRRIADAFRSLQQRARRQLQTGPITKPSPSATPSTPEAGRLPEPTGTPASAPTDAELSTPNGRGKQEDEDRGGSGSAQGSAHLRQSTSPTAGPDGKNTAPARGQEKTPRATRTPGLRGSATGAFVHATATSYPTTAPTSEPTIESTTAPDRGRNSASQNSDESSGGQQSSGGSSSSGGGSSSSGGGSSSSGSGGNSSGGSRGGGKK